MKALRQPLAGPVFSALAAWMFFFSAIAGEQVNSISLAGTWRFRLDPNSVGVTNLWFKETLEDSVTLPGTTDTNQKGVFKDERAVDRLSRVWYWKGPAWYQRAVVIPESWNGRRMTLESTRHPLAQIALPLRLQDQVELAGASVEERMGDVRRAGEDERTDIRGDRRRNRAADQGPVQPGRTVLAERRDEPGLRQTRLRRLRENDHRGAQAPS